MMLSLWFLLVHAAFSHGGFFVGNGGEGVSFPREVLLRDFVEAGLEDLRVPVSSDGFISPELFKFSALENAALAGELNRIEAIDPGFGWALAKTVRAHDWLFVRKALRPVPPDPGEVVRFPRELLVPVANRYQNSVRVHEATWRLMPMRHRIGLVLHEAIFSLATPACGPDGDCHLLNLDVRNLTASLFSATQKQELEFLRHRLNIFGGPAPAVRVLRAGTEIAIFPLAQAFEEIQCPREAGVSLELVGAPKLVRAEHRRKKFIQQTFYVLPKTEKREIFSCGQGSDGLIQGLLMEDTSSIIEARVSLLFGLQAAFSPGPATIQDLLAILPYARQGAGCGATAFSFLGEPDRMRLALALPLAEQVRLAYAAIFRRNPDSEGGRYYLDRMQQGLTLGQLFSALLGSQEFREFCST